MVKIFQNWSQYGVTHVTNFFQNFEVDTKIPKSPKLALITKILKKILKTFSSFARKLINPWCSTWQGFIIKGLPPGNYDDYFCHFLLDENLGYLMQIWIAGVKFNNLEPTKFVILRIFGPNFVQIWQFWCRWKAGDEIYPNLAKLNWEISKICQNRKFGFRVKDPKFGFELGLRISKFRFSPKFKIWPKIKIPPRWFIITLRFTKFESQNFPKLVRIYLEPTKFVILRIFWIKFGDFVKIWILVILWNLKSLTLAKIKIWDR